MTKKQKIWLAVFGAMFIVPEILWSSTTSFIYIMIFPEKFSDLPLLFSILPSPNNNLTAGIINIVQFIGSSGFVLLFLNLKIRKLTKILIILLLTPLIFASGFIALMAFYYLFNTPQIG